MSLQDEDRAVTENAPTSQEAYEVLRRALARTHVLDVFTDKDETAAARIAQAEPTLALVAARWLDDAFTAGQMLENEGDLEDDTPKTT